MGHHGGNSGGDHGSSRDLPLVDSAAHGAVMMYASGTSSGGVPDSTIVEPSAAEEALSPKSVGLCELEEYLKEPTFDSMEDAFEYLCNSARAELATMSQQSSLNKSKFESESEIAPEQEGAPLAPATEQAPLAPEPEQAPSVAAQGPCSKASDEEIAQNGKKWMREEAMVAFKKYIEDRDEFKDIQYEFGELQHQCFSVKNYHEIFHHFNFTVKMKVNVLADWTSELFFAEVKEILRRKIYFCSPLEPHENGQCYACKKQGMDDLRHPIIGVYDRGNPDAVFPFMEEGDVDDYGFMYYDSE
ncbi:unnamed protein product [Urochloa decumbens]|uniref:DUF3615 domain-containing protein n=1 Tax=Urochloa decumbens TaxID=240449 RepID=A0ABC8VA62_9POAL